MLHKVMGDTTATTRPVESLTPVDFGDLTADVRKLKANPKPAAVESPAGAAPAPPARTEQQLHDAWANFLADLAWYQIYFLQKPDEAKPTIDALRELTGEKAPVIARLEGWSFLVNGHADEARVKLSAVADTDALSRLGIIKLLASDPRNQRGRRKRGKTAARSRLGHAGGDDRRRVSRCESGPKPARRSRCADQHRAERLPHGVASGAGSAAEFLHGSGRAAEGGAPVRRRRLS